ncbi:MAG: hypothetical protein AAF772_18615, partial [Acidobacteriota bacterium]
MRPIVHAFVAFPALLLLLASAALAQPSFNKTFSPATIGPGAHSELTFTITNGSGAVARDLAFTDVLPAGVTLGAAADPITDCPNATLTAPDGGTTITFADGDLGAFASCTIRVYVTATAAGTYMNVSGDLTSDQGNSGPASADLTLATNRPGFSKSFSAASIEVGDITTLTFVLDNTLVGNNVFNASFTDFLPPSLQVANPPNASVDCVAVFTPAPGDTAVSLFSGFLMPGQVCTAVVDLEGVAIGNDPNVTEPASSTAGTSGLAVAPIEVTMPMRFLDKDFIDDPAAPGETTTLEFTLTNFDRDSAATNITFTDDLDAALTGLVAVGLPLNDVCGTGSQISGTSTLTFTGGTLLAAQRCTFSVTLQVPAAATPGSYVNTTSSASYDLGGAPTTAPPVSSTLRV